MPALQGDFGGLEDLAERVRKITRPGFKEAVARRLTGTAIKLLADEFRKSQNPYGEPWAPVSRNRPRDIRARAARARAGKPPRGDKPLIDTGRLRAAAVGQGAGQASGGMVRVVIPVSYASYHQDGTRRMVRRQIIPDRAGGLGPIWAGAFRKEIELAFLQNMKPGGGKAAG